ncbi:SDR family oxidoreductase [Undibacter mobilis]|uniref:NAD-dependent epimerase/dehydratase family protein n=1 Tax=Undibacter mobilis TaxID=2292256 RepID=A0A371BCZ9_9BRAD|nr:SDR family oxidoreductase [Undibacter mobilis]RDV05438.1 NAD-dependent epimerase/dehydratase family protein [Undibacter mobilis]
MRVFVTGATGFVGAAVVQDLIGAGHSVLGLTRSDKGAAELRAAGAEVHQGSLEDLDSLIRGAKAVDAVIHTAFNHDFTRFVQSCEDDRRIVEAMGNALVGTGKTLIVTSGTGVVHGLATEDSEPGQHPRAASEYATAAAASRGVRAMIVRLPQVHGDGDHAFVPLTINLAREKGEAVYIGDGSNRWPAVHRFDAAPVYRLALEKGTAFRYHAVAEEGVPFRDIAEVTGRRLNVPVVSKTRDEAAAHFGWFIHFASADMPASSAKTRAELKWNPAGPKLLPDIDREIYFET